MTSANPTPGPAMSGLTVRWSLVDAPAEVAEKLAAYVEDASHARFEVMPGLRFKTWRMRPGEWFEGCYVFVDDDARARFEAEFTAGAAAAPGSMIVGAAPVLIEPCQVVATAAGGAGFVSAPAFDR
jgi:hypothetical protein